ncbi:hypothetical protein BUE76_22160 [Cnuella takakiae]|nr:hypothetical protein BUE76_22160 [Cnuella takakiae]
MHQMPYLRLIFPSLEMLLTFLERFTCEDWIVSQSGYFLEGNLNDEMINTAKKHYGALTLSPPSNEDGD